MSSLAVNMPTLLTNVGSRYHENRILIYI